MVYEEGEKNMLALLEWYGINKGARNEAATRFQIIDRLFRDCLGWEADNIHVEERMVDGGGFSDYTFKLPHGIMTVEAKKEGLSFSLPDNTERNRTLKSLLQGDDTLKKAVEQVIGYCNKQGVPIAGVTNGFQLIIFIGTRTDSTPPLEGKALVFASLQEMYDNFTDIWNLLSQKCINADNICNTVNEQAIIEPPPKASKSILSYPETKKVYSDLQEDLSISAELVFNELIGKGEVEEEFLKDCYIKTDDLSRYTLQGKEILKSRYSELTKLGVKSSKINSLLDHLTFKSSRPSHTEVLITQRPILIVGDMNVGKTSFIRNFIKIEADDILEKFINIYIDLQTQATLEASIKDFVPKEIVRQLSENYNIDIQERNFLRGIYRKDIEQFKNSIYSETKNFPKSKYKEHEIDFIANKARENPNEHLQKALKQITKQQKKQIVIFIDNADQRSESDQQSTILIAQELAKQSNLSVFVSLRPESFSKLTDLGILESGNYHSRVFTIQPPALEEVIKKRLTFGLRITTGEIEFHEVKGLKTQFIKLNILIHCFLNTLEEDKNFSEIIENLANGDVRLGLKMAQNFLGNPHMNQEGWLSRSEGKYFPKISFDYFLKSIILEDNIYYVPDHKYVANLFDISSLDGKEHFAAPLLLGYLDQVSGKESMGFIETKNIFDAMQAMGFIPSQINRVIDLCLSKGIVEQETRRSGTTSETSRVRLTASGVYHLKKMCSLFEYMNAIIVDTPVLDETTRVDLKVGEDIRERLYQTNKFSDYLDQQWKEIDSPYFDWPQHSAQLKENIKKIEEGMLPPARK